MLVFINLNFFSWNCPRPFGRTFEVSIDDAGCFQLLIVSFENRNVIFIGHLYLLPFNCHTSLLNVFIQKFFCQKNVLAMKAMMLFGFHFVGLTSYQRVRFFDDYIVVYNYPHLPVLKDWLDEMLLLLQTVCKVTLPHHHNTTSPHYLITSSPHHHITTSPHYHITSLPHHLNTSSLGFGEMLGAHRFTVVKLKSNMLASVKCGVISVKLWVPSTSNFFFQLSLL